MDFAKKLLGKPSEAEKIAKTLGCVEDGFRTRRLSAKMTILEEDSRTLGHQSIQEAKEDLVRAAGLVSKNKQSYVKAAIRDVEEANQDVASAWTGTEAEGVVSVEQELDTETQSLMEKDSVKSQASEIEDPLSQEEGEESKSSQLKTGEDTVTSLTYGRKPEILDLQKEQQQSFFSGLPEQPEGWQAKSMNAASEGLTQAKVGVIVQSDATLSQMNLDGRGRAAVEGHVGTREGRKSVSSSSLMESIRAMSMLLMHDGFDTKEYRRMYQESYSFYELLRHLMAYVFLGGNFISRVEKVKGKAYGNLLMKELTKDGFMIARNDGGTLTLPRVAHAYFPVLFSLRTVMSKEGTLPKSNIKTTTPPILRDLAFSGCLSAVPAARDYQYVMGAFLHDHRNNNARGTTKPEDMVEEVNGWCEVASAGVTHDGLLSQAMHKMHEVKLEDWEMIFGFDKKTTVEETFSQERAYSQN